jgi:GxxExxY protein
MEREDQKNPVDPVNPLKSELQDAALTQTIIGCAMKVHRILGPGFLESVYQKALAHELRKAGLSSECKTSIRVRYCGVVVGDFTVDLLVEGRIILENKAVRALSPSHEVQLVNYLTATGKDIGLLLNFGAPSLQFKRKHREYKRRQD